MSGPTIDVIVPQWNQIERTERFLESFEKFRLPSMRLILVENGSTGPLYKLVALTRRVLDGGGLTISISHNAGFVRGTNAGLAVSDADFVVLQNNDTRVFRGSYRRMFDVFERDPKVGLVGPVVSPCTSLQSVSNVWRESPFSSKFLQGELTAGMPEDVLCQQLAVRMHQITQDRKMLAFFCTAIRRQVIEQIGFLDPAYGPGMADDDDYCERARRAGWRISLACDAYVHHDHRSTFRTLYDEEALRALQQRNIEIYRKKFGKDP